MSGPGALPIEERVAVDCLVGGAESLSVPALRELARRLTDVALRAEQDHHHDLHPLAAGDRRFIGALRAVAEVTGGPPSTTVYTAEFQRRRDLGDTSLPSASSILKHFDAWGDALAAAGLVAVPAPEGVRRRRRLPDARRVAYADEQLTEALVACAGLYGHPPAVRDYVAWYEDVIGGRRRRPGHVDRLPHYRTFYNRFGAWSLALEAAGLDPRRRSRTPPYEGGEAGGPVRIVGARAVDYSRARARLTDAAARARATGERVEAEVANP